MSDIDLYSHSYNQYEELQEKRPDYTHARRAFLDLALVQLKDKAPVSITDFCCGTGNNTKLLAEHVTIGKATLIDINKRFLESALQSQIKAREVVTIESDILKAQLAPEYDLVISMFAYHHVPDADKGKYIEVVKSALKPGGILLLGEIYSPDKNTTRAYYSHLLEAIPASERTPELETFLRQTAESEEFEYKVSRTFAHDQLRTAGFTLLHDTKIWPTDATFAKDVGTFVEVWGGRLA
jgi:putative AdoMet-dependent methyltransferase